MKYYVYALHSKNNGIFYIGVTANIKQRYTSHLNCSKYKSSHDSGRLYEFIRKYNISFDISVICVCNTKSEAYYKEAKWIRGLSVNNYMLVNSHGNTRCHLFNNKILKNHAIKNPSFSQTIVRFPSIRRLRKKVVRFERVELYLSVSIKTNNKKDFPDESVISKSILLKALTCKRLKLIEFAEVCRWLKEPMAKFFSEKYI